MSDRPNNSSPKVIVYACSGCSDAGELADRIARRLASEQVAEMSCLAGIGGQVKSLVNKAASAERILVIDGCPLACGRNTFHRAGFDQIEHLGLHELGLRKGNCSVDEMNLSIGLKAAKLRISSPTMNANSHATPE